MDMSDPTLGPMICAVGVGPGGAKALHAFLDALDGPASPACVVLCADPLPAALEIAPWPADDRPAPGLAYAAPERFARASLELDDGRAPPPTRDALFESVAALAGERAIGVLLAADGTDGLAGLATITSIGGLALASPAAAELPGPGLRLEEAAERIDAPAALAALVGRHVGARRRRGTADGVRRPPTPSLDAQQLREACDILRAVTGHDFRHYKESTLSRRVERRVHLHRLDDVDAYLARLGGDADEARALMRDLLIGVTAFFRDPEAFSALQVRVLERLIDADGEEGVRLWVAGCGTGQEAYSLAMLVAERIEASGSRQDVQIFATDLDERALAVARRGVYSLAQLEPVSPERLQRFFERDGAQMRVGKSLRQRIVFSPHNLISDPPFSRMDLISCRNLMIYLGAHLQKKLMGVFHYALRDSGHLFLGSSEAVTGHADLFRAVDARARIAQRRDTGLRDAAVARPVTGAGNPGRQYTLPGEEADIGAISQRILLDEFAPPYLLVGETGQITFSSPNTDRWLQQPTGQYVNHVMRVVRDGARSALRSAWSRALAERRTAVQEGLALDADGERRRLRITVQPMPELGEDGGLYMVVFADLGAAGGDSAAAGPGASEHHVEELEAELLRTRAELERTVQDLEAANEELKSSNEELISMNEELQSSNEELEASKNEIEHGAVALEEANTDLVNLLRSTEIATIFLDVEGRLRNFTPAAAELYNITQADIDRPLAHFTHNFRTLPPPPGDAAAGDDAEAVHLDGRVFLRRRTPYRDADGEPVGTVLSFVDVSEATRAERALRSSRHQLRLVTDHAPVMLAQVDVGRHYRFVNAGYAALFDAEPDELVGRSVAEVLGEAGWAFARGRLDAAFAGDRVEYDFSLAELTGDDAAAERWLQVSYRLEFGPDGEARSVVAAIVDVSERRAAEQALRWSEERFQAVHRSSPDGFIIFRSLRDAAGSIEDFAYDYFNPAAAAIVGRPAEQLASATLLGVTPGNLDNGLFEAYCAVVETGQPFKTFLEYRRDGIDGAFEITAVRIGDGFAVSFSDVSGQRAAERRAALIEDRLEDALSAGGGVGTWDWDVPGDVVRTDADFARLFGLEPDAARAGVPIARFLERIHPEDVSCVRAAVDIALADTEGGTPYTQEFRVRDAHGRVRWVQARGRIYRDAKGGPVRFPGVLLDIDERRETELALRESEARLTRTLDGVGTLIGLLEPDGRVRDINATAMRAIGGNKSDVIGEAFWATPWWSVSEELRAKVASLIERAAAGETVREDLPWSARDGQRVVDFTIAPVFDGDGRVVALVPSGTDITERRAVEAQRELLLGELNHRVKNLLATIRGMASHTLRHADSLPAFRRAFDGRLAAIAAAHDLLVDDAVHGASLEELVQRQIGPYVSIDGVRVSSEGPALALAAGPAHTLALVLHELTTNATKHGALSVESGRLAIAWRPVDLDGLPAVELHWAESDGPPVTPPTRRGFGSVLIESSLAHSLGGEAELDYAPTGLRARLVAPLGQERGTDD